MKCTHFTIFNVFLKLNPIIGLILSFLIPVLLLLLIVGWYRYKYRGPLQKISSLFPSHVSFNCHNLTLKQLQDQINNAFRSQGVRSQLGYDPHKGGQIMLLVSVELYKDEFQAFVLLIRRNKKKDLIDIEIRGGWPNPFPLKKGVNELIEVINIALNKIPEVTNPEWH